MTFAPVDYERDQRHRTLTVMLYITFGVIVALGVNNTLTHNWLAVISMVVLSLFCLFSWGMNTRGRYRSAAVIFCVAVVSVANFNLIYGAGVRDAGIVAYPCLIILGTLLLGKRAAPSLLLVCTVSVATVAWAEMAGLIRPHIPPMNIGVIVSIFIFLSSASLMIWVIMKNLEHNFAQIQQSEVEIRTAYELTLEGWAKALEYRDKETEGHSRRVTEMSIILARELGCNEHDILQIRHGALLHDIGKIAVPDKILLKTDSLDSEERAIIEQHPLHAREMLKPIDFLKSAICIPYSHHERWDGTGYPQGLKGKEIPFFARIFTVVDQWEALSSDRPYRQAWSHERVIDYLQENKEIIFDPEIVDAFVALLQRGTPVVPLVPSISDTPPKRFIIPFM
jgi:putative nucleotidyltransferase with HDIG domain